MKPEVTLQLCVDYSVPDVIGMHQVVLEMKSADGWTQLLHYAFIHFVRGPHTNI
jgi:hypothetical protein